jgi:hypothetical protein
MDNVAPRRDVEVLARKLADVRRRLNQMDLPAGAAERLHRQFIAICDALKVPEADAVAGLRRLSAFLATLEQAVSKSSRNKSPKDKSTS